MITRTVMLTTILVAITSIVFSSITMAFERSHNVKSLRPFINVLQTSNQNSISLTIDNAGLGPMLIERITLYPKNTPDTNGKKLSDILPAETSGAKIFQSNELYALASKDQLLIFEFSVDNQAIELVSSLRVVLSGYSLHIDYRDVYDHKYKKDSEINFELSPL